VWQIKYLRIWMELHAPLKEVCLKLERMIRQEWRESLRNDDYYEILKCLCELSFRQLKTCFVAGKSGGKEEPVEMQENGWVGWVREKNQTKMSAKDTR